MAAMTALDSGVARLEASSEPLIRYRTLLDVAGRSPDEPTGDPAAAAAVARAAEFFLRHRVLYSERTHEPVNPRVPLLHYPPYWHFDLLAGLRVLGEAGRLEDPRVADALDLLESKRGPDGTWAIEATYTRKPGSRGSNVDVVDWGRVGAPSEPATLSALLVLHAAARLRS